jgi:hypothetical protein
MAAAKKYSVEQIVAKLREREKLQGQGLTIPQANLRPDFLSLAPEVRRIEGGRGPGD